MKIIIRVFLISLFLVQIPALGVKAASQPKAITYKGIGISPAITQVSLDQNLPQTTFKISVANLLDTPQTLTVSSLDFKSLNQSGGIAFIGGSASKYGLANWLILPKQPIKLAAHDSQVVQITVQNRADLAPGGHYASILFKNSSSQIPGKNKVDVNQVVAALVFAKKSGGEIYDISAIPPKFGLSWLRLPGTVDLLIKNTGNTQTAPRGTIVITDPASHEIKRGIINPDSALVLPDSTRLFSTSLNSTTQPWLPGRYHATISYEPSDTNVAKTVTYSFWYLSLPTVAFVAILVLCLAIVIKGLLLRPRHPRK